MKLYDFAMAPNPRRVRMFLAEKGVEIPTVQVNIRDREQFTDEFAAINPSRTVPVLELDDGTCLTETVAICRYIEETQPEPALMGGDAKDRAIVEMWNRRCELEGMAAIGEVARNSVPMFEDRGLPGVSGGVPQIPALVERGKASLARFQERIDKRLAESRYVAGDSFTIADITAFVALNLAERFELTIPDSCTNLARWYAEVGARPSTQA